MNPAEPDAMLTTIKPVKSQSKQAGQEYTVFTNDQQLFKIATQVTWYKSYNWKDFFAILGGIHTLMSFVGCIGTLTANTGPSDLLKSSFRGVEKILSGKNFLQNTTALRICVEKILRSILQDESIPILIV